MKQKLLLVTGLLFVVSTSLAIQRCSSGADEAAAYVAANCEHAVSEVIREGGEITESDMDSALEKCLADYERSPEYEASVQAFLHMVGLMAASVLFGVTFIVLAILKVVRKET